jgi:hypothetical protein
MYLPKSVLDLLVARDGNAPPYTISIISKDEARQAFESFLRDGIEINDSLGVIDASLALYRLREEGGYRTEILCNEAGSVLLLRAIKPI